jgi:hypothetical protein
LKQYGGDGTTFKQVTKDYCTGFIEYLKTAQNKVYRTGISETYRSGLLSQTAQYNYVNLLFIALNRTVTDGILQVTPA